MWFVKLMSSQTGGGMSDIMAAVSSAIGMLGDVVSTLMGQPLFVFLIGVSLVPVGFKIFKMAKGTAKK